MSETQLNTVVTPLETPRSNQNEATSEAPKTQAPAPVMDAILRLGLTAQYLRGVTPADIGAVNSAAKNWIGRREAVTAAKAAVKAASSHASRLSRELERDETRLIAETAFLLDEARVAAELAGAPINTRGAIKSAMVLARTGPQRLSLLLKLQNYEREIARISEAKQA